MKDTRNQFIAIVVVTLIAAYLIAPIENKPMPGILKEAVIKLGIDIAGGAELRYRLLFPPDFRGDKAQAGQQVVSVLNNRINTKGLKEPRIQTHGDEFVLIQLAGVDQEELKDYKSLISNVGNLELKKVATKEKHEQYNIDKIVPDGFEALSSTEARNSEAPWIQDVVLVEKAAVITGDDVSRASHQVDIRHGKANYKIDFELKVEGAKDFDNAAAELFKRTPHGQIAIIIDGVLKSAPAVNSASFKGQGEITGNFDENAARDLAIVLRSGSLPVPIGRIEDGKAVPKIPEADSFIGPSLGQDAIMRGIIASLASLLGVTIFMIVYYRGPGFIAVVSLIINLVMLLAIMAIFGATLTLPGIAGIALTVGMAIDANILVFERMREEVDKGKSMAQAFAAGHDRAFVTIVDSNVTTALAGVVLYYFGTGPVQGFAITLCVGIMTTLISVLWCSKVFLQMSVASGSIKQLKFMRAMANAKYDFLKFVRPAVIASVIAVVVLMGVFWQRGEKNFGIDFKGGSVLTFAFRERSDINIVRDRVRTIKEPANGLPRYPDAEIQTVAEPGATMKDIKFTKGDSRQFQLRDRTQNDEQLQADIQELFKDELSHIPFEPVKDLPDESRMFASGPPGAGWLVYLRDVGKFDFEATKKLLIEAMNGVLEKDPNTGLAELNVKQMPDAPKGIVKLRLLISERDARVVDKSTKVRNELKKMGASGAIALSTDPFVAKGRLGATVAQELKTSSTWAMIAAWALMIAYIAIRFSSYRFGVAAVVALVHDVLIAIGFVSLLGAIVPATMGLSFDMNMTFVAAILTVIGYSINDKIVIYDRVRENLSLMKKESFSEIINTSVNQTMSRTILTGTGTILTCMLMYGATATSGGGIAEFALPLLIGTIVGTYSSIYTALPIVLKWFGKEKPQMT